MANKCRRVITLHKICRILQIEENIFISHQTLTYAGRSMVTVHFLQNHNTQGGTGKFIYKPSNIR